VFDTQTDPDRLTSWTVNYKWRQLIASRLLLLAEDDIWQGTVNEIADTVDEANRLIVALYGDVDTMALGAIHWYSADGPLPSGWLLCDGTVYDMVDYPDLGSLYGDKYGGDGVDTFGVPDLVGHFIRGTDSSPGAESGQDQVTLSVAQLPAHTHTYDYPSPNADFEAGGVPDPFAVGNPGVSTNTGSTGSGDAVPTVPLHLTMLPMVKAVTTGVVMTTPQQVPSPFVVGEIRTFAFDVAPTGWLICDGGGYNTALYPDLFDAIGYTFGGSGNTFVLPDYGGRVNVGINPADSDFDVIADTGGSKTHTLTVAQMPSHTHDYGLADSGVSINAERGQLATTATGTTSSTGGGEAHNNLQPYITMLVCIRYAP